jgi:hypothetical protein
MVQSFFYGVKFKLEFKLLLELLILKEKNYLFFVQFRLCLYFL